MVKPGDVIVNTITKEIITFTQTAATTGGKLLEFRLELAPGSRVPMKHIHTLQDEIFEVITGRVNVEFGKQHVILNPGERAVMPRGIPHRWWNDPLQTSILTVKFDPAFNTEDFFTEIFQLASAGKTRPNGSPTLLQAAKMCGKYNIYHPFIPVFLQKSAYLFFNNF